MEKECTANVIAENMHAQCNPDGQQFLLLSSIIDHKKDDTAIQKAEQGFNPNGCKQLKKKATRGWLLCIEWKDGTTTWEKLSNMKESFPTEVAKLPQ